MSEPNVEEIVLEIEAEMAKRRDTLMIDMDSARALIVDWRKRGEEITDLKSDVVTFLVLWATRYQIDYGLDGLHPVHYDRLKACGARMGDFKRATNHYTPEPPR